MIADLAPWEEAVGRLEAVEEDRGALVLSLRCLIKIRIPSGADLEEELRRIVGRKIGLLRTDSGVLFRVLDGNDDKLRVSSARGPPTGRRGDKCWEGTEKSRGNPGSRGSSSGRLTRNWPGGSGSWPWTMGSTWGSTAPAPPTPFALIPCQGGLRPRAGGKRSSVPPPRSRDQGPDRLLV
jgi:hypothetical protein